MFCVSGKSNLTPACGHSHNRSNQPASQPANQSTSQPANQPANQPTSQPASQPTHQRASRRPAKLRSNSSVLIEPTVQPTSGLLVPARHHQLAQAEQIGKQIFTLVPFAYVEQLAIAGGASQRRDRFRASSMLLLLLVVVVMPCFTANSPVLARRSPAPAACRSSGPSGGYGGMFRLIGFICGRGPVIVVGSSCIAVVSRLLEQRFSEQSNGGTQHLNADCTLLQ
uniref:Uncharacterized protein n=1 Tax=Anopheles melas TaxID=34690 RepID=A0A182UKI0_9DIPT